MSAIRIGITAMGDGPIGGAAGAIQELTDRLPIDRAGHLWIAEAYVFRDALAQATIALATTTTARVATGIANVYTRHPALLAMTAATLDEAYPGRFVLGVGAGQRGWMQQLGLEPRTPMRDVERTCALLADLREQGRGSIELDGRTSGELRMTRALRRRVPVVVGTNGPKSIAMAGRSADGVLLSFYDGDPERLAELVAGFGPPADDAIGCVAQCIVVGPWLNDEERERVDAMAQRLGAMAPPERRPRAFDLAGDGLQNLLDELAGAGVTEVALVAPFGRELRMADALVDFLNTRTEDTSQ